MKHQVLGQQNSKRCKIKAMESVKRKIEVCPLQQQYVQASCLAEFIEHLLGYVSLLSIVDGYSLFHLPYLLWRGCVSRDTLFESRMR